MNDTPQDSQTLTADEAEICEDIWATYSHGLPTGTAHAKGFQQGASEKQRMWIENAARRILARAALNQGQG